MIAGTAAAAVPVIIHLLNRKEVRQVDWAAMRFLREAVQQNQRRLRIEDLLLLLLRCLLLILLALTLARPAVHGAALSGRGATTAVVIIDSSYSMSASDGMRSAFDRAKDAAATLIGNFPVGSKAAVWTSSDAVNPIIPEPTADLSLVRTSVASAARTDRATDVLPALRRAIELLRHVEGPREIDFFTDGQSSGFHAMEDVRQTLAGASEVSTHFILIRTPAVENLCLSELRPMGEMMLSNRSIRFLATVTNTGLTEAHAVPVSLRVDGGDPVDQSIVPSIPAGGSANTFLFARLATEGDHTITASLPPDRLAADDNRTIAVHALAGVHVLMVDGQSTAGRDSGTFYLQRLFAVGDTSENDNPETPPVTATIISPGDLQQQSLDNLAAIILADVPSLTEKSSQTLRDYVQRGGGLLVFAGDDVQPAFYNEQLLSRLKLLPAEYGDARGEPNANHQLMTLESSSHYDHPIAEVWNGWNGGNVGLPGLVNIFRVMPLTPDRHAAADPAGTPRIVLRFSDRTPAVMERAYGLGRVIQFAIPANATWDDLPLHVGTFVPLIFRSLAAIVNRQQDGLNVRAGSPFLFHPDAQFLNQDATIVPPNSDGNAAHDVRPVQLMGSEPTLSDEQTELAGAYSVSFADGTSIRFAVQSDPNESKLDPLTDQQQRELSSVARVSDNSPDLTATSTSKANERSLGEWWPELTVATIALAAVEMTFAGWFSRAK